MGVEHLVKFTSNQVLKLEWEAVVDLFDPVVTSLLSEIAKVLSAVRRHEIKYLLLVGGFSESRYLQNAVKRMFGNEVEILIPWDAQLAVNIGAVRFGHQPQKVKSRIARFSYGIEVTAPFKKGVHKTDYRIDVDGEAFTEKIFEPFVQKGEEIPVNFVIKKRFGPVYRQQKEIVLGVYAMPSVPAKTQYVTDEQVRKVGTITIKIPTARKVSDECEREVFVRFKFGGTEVQVEAICEFTETRRECIVDFL